MNLFDIQSIPKAEIEIKDETGAPTGVFFEMAGPTHPERKALTFAQSRKNIARFQKAGKVEPLDPEEAEELNREQLAAFTLGVRGWPEFTFSKKAVLDLYRDDAFAWLVSQLSIGVNEQERFMKRSAKG